MILGQFILVEFTPKIIILKNKNLLILANKYQQRKTLLNKMFYQYENKLKLTLKLPIF